MAPKLSIKLKANNVSFKNQSEGIQLYKNTFNFLQSNYCPMGDHSSLMNSSEIPGQNCPALPYELLLFEVKGISGEYI